MNDFNTLIEAKKWFLQQSNSFDDLLFNRLIRDLFDLSDVDFLLKQHDFLTDLEKEKIKSATTKLLTGKPLQYVIGFSRFYGRKFIVNPNVLIPRVETEELIDWILSDYKNDNKPLSILDLGTGSGVIAITLSLEFPESKVIGSDISDKALSVARLNALRLNKNVELINSNLFENIKNQKFDLIVSNPPYISKDEIDLMDSSVLNYEPHDALFASENGLLFYKKILPELDSFLSDHGKAYFEFGFRQKNKIKQLCNKFCGNKFMFEFKKDVSNNDRMLKIKRNLNNK